MANSLDKNTIYIDATGSISGLLSPSFIFGLLLTPSSTSGCTFTLKKTDTNGQICIRVDLLDDMTRYIPFNIPIIVPSTIFVATLTTVTNAQLYGVFE